MALITVNARCNAPHRGKVPWWRSLAVTGCSGADFFAIDRSGVLAGVVTRDGGFLLHNAVVTLYLRNAGVLIDKQLTDVNGVFEFSGLDRTSSDYLIVVHPSRYNPAYNAIVFDQLTPV